MFYDEDLGLLKISDGITPGGRFVSVLPATTTLVGGIKAGAGANVSADGTLTINTAGLPLSIGDLSIVQANISTVNSSEDLNLITNASGNVNIIGNLRVQTTMAGLYSTPVLTADNRGNLTVNGNLITNGGTYFIGPVTHEGNITITGNLIVDGITQFIGNVSHIGSTTFTGDVTQTGNLSIIGNTVNTGNSIFIGNVQTTGILTITGNTNQVGNLVITGQTINNGLSIFNGDITLTGNAVISGNTSITGTTFVTGNTTVTGNTLVTGNTSVVGVTYLAGNSYVSGNTTVTGNTYVVGNTTVTGTTYVVGNTYVTGQVTTITGNTYLQGNSYVIGNTFVQGPTTVTGNITITGNSTQSGSSIFVITQQNSTQGAMEITGDTGSNWQTPVNTGVMLQVTGQSSLVSRVYNDSVGNYSLYTGRRMEGSIANPTGVQGNVDIVRFAGTAYTTGGWANIGPARITFTTSEVLTGTNQGGRIEFWTTANSAGPAYSTITRTATIDPALGVTATGFVTGGNVTAGNVTVTNNESVGGNVTVTGNVTAGSFINTVASPSVVSNAYTLDLSTAPNMMILNNGAVAFTVTMINPIPGKRVVLVSPGLGGAKVTVNGLTAANSFNNTNQYAGLNGPTGAAVVELICSTTANAGVYLNGIVAK
jgi:hypothetical protein